MVAQNQVDTVSVILGGEVLRPLPEGGLWWARLKTLIVSDLHFEKGSSYASHGQMLPPYDTAATLLIVEKLVARWQPERVISLGDSFHDGKADQRLADTAIARIRALTQAADWIWVEGNHDPDPPQHLGGRAMSVLRSEELVFRHEPTHERNEISGHLHPVAKVAGRAGTIRSRCFIASPARLIMPAIGAYTGGLNILHDAVTRLFPDHDMAVYVIGRERTYPVATSRLRPDIRAARTGARSLGAAANG